MTTDHRDLAETETTRSMLDQLLTDSRLYRTGREYQALLDFAVQLRNVAPFNALLLQLQKPGLRFVASAFDWRERFGRAIKDGARPLLILWPFGPVATVYDVQDTEGKELPDDVNCFVARGNVDPAMFHGFRKRMAAKKIYCEEFDGGDGNAGAIRIVQRGVSDKEPTIYRMLLNRNHAVSVRFVTLAHELGHLFLGHLGADKALSVPRRQPLTYADQELEAESVAYVVAARSGVKSKSQTYLAGSVKRETTIDDLDVYQVMRAAGQVETLLGLISPTRFEPPRPRMAARSAVPSNAAAGVRTAIAGHSVQAQPGEIRTVQSQAPETPNTDLDARLAASKAKRDAPVKELTAHLSSKITAGVDPTEVS